MHQSQKAERPHNPNYYGTHRNKWGAPRAEKEEKYERGYKKSPADKEPNFINNTLRIQRAYVWHARCVNVYASFLFKLFNKRNKILNHKILPCGSVYNVLFHINRRADALLIRAVNKSVIKWQSVEKLVFVYRQIRIGKSRIFYKWHQFKTRRIRFFCKFL